MTQDTKLKELKEVIMEANPEIMERPMKLVKAEYGMAKNLGRPITLADVLIAFKNKKSSIQVSSPDGHMYGFEYEGDDEPLSSQWNLKENLDNQEPATIDFLWDLLVKKK